MVVWYFQPNYYYSYFYYAVGWWKIIFQKSKRPQTHLLMSFNSIRIIAGYTFSTPKIYMYSDWWWLVGISNKTIIIFIFIMLLVDGKSFFSSQKDLKLIYLWAAIALEIWLVIHFKQQKSICGVTGWWWLLIVSSQIIAIFTFSTLLHDGKSFFIS